MVGSRENFNTFVDSQSLDQLSIFLLFIRNPESNQSISNMRTVRLFNPVIWNVTLLNMECHIYKYHVDILDIFS